MTNQQIKQSTWRERQVDLHPGVNEITFADTKPNHILINNLGSSVLTFGATIIPNLSIYDKQINPFGEMLYARDTGLTRCLVYVEGLDNCSIILTSFEDVFNPAALASSTSNGGSSGGGGSFDGVIRGIAVPLPSGNNNIGRVVVTGAPANTPTTLIAPIPNGPNKIGKVEIVDPLPAGTNKVGKVEIADPLPTGANKIGGVDVVSPLPAGMNHIGVVSVQPKTKHCHYVQVVTTTETAITLPFTVKEWNYISNDGDNDVLIALNSKTTMDTQNGENGVIVLKKGESISHFIIDTNTIKLKTVKDSSSIRLLGVN